MKIKDFFLKFLTLAWIYHILAQPVTLDNPVGEEVEAYTCFNPAECKVRRLDSQKVGECNQSRPLNWNGMDTQYVATRNKVPVQITRCKVVQKR